MNEEILTSIKEYLGITEDYTYFDKQISSDINSCFGILSQLGAGPDNGFKIDPSDDPGKTWNNYTSDTVLYELVREYVEKQVRLMFDPPSSSFVLESHKRLIDELTWRINVYVDPSERLSEDN